MEFNFGSRQQVKLLLMPKHLSACQALIDKQTTACYGKFKILTSWSHLYTQDGLLDIVSSGQKLELSPSLSLLSLLPQTQNSLIWLLF